MTKWVLELNPTVADMVGEFLEKTGQEPTPNLYISLISEEFDEFVDAIPFSEEELKELADLVYVIYGYADACGYNLDEAVRRVHANNLGRCTQPDGTVKRREDGKILKNPEHPKVYLKDLLPEWAVDAFTKGVKL
jgi:NTP pyrophosphatase (non-canonical NTP hydrolase)